MGAFVDVADKLAFSPDKMRKNGLFASERMFCDVYCFEAGQTQAAHAHAGSDKIYYVLDGTAEIQIGDETRRIAAGGAAYAAPGEPHGVTNPGPGRLSVLVFMAPKP